MTFRPLVTQALPKRDVPVAVSSQPVQNLAGTTLAPIITNISVTTNYDQPNPIRKGNIVAQTSQPYINLSNTTLYGQDALPCQSQNTFNPWGRVGVVTNRADNVSINLNLYAGAAPVPPQANYDQPNPVRRKWADYNYFYGMPDTLLSIVPALPDNQYNWPNPILRKWSDYYSYVLSTPAELRAVVNTIPQGKQSFINPYLSTVRRQDFNPPQPLSITTYVPPAVTTVHNTFFIADVGRMMSR